MDNSIFSLIALIIIVAGAITYGSFFYHKKWKTKKTEKEVYRILSESYINDHRNSLNGTDIRKAVELGLKSRCYRMQIEKLSYDSRYTMAFDFLKSAIDDTNEMTTEERTTMEDLKEIFKKVTHMDLEWDADRSINE